MGIYPHPYAVGARTAGRTCPEITERPDGVVELRPALPVPADQAWFWTEHWQKREREVDDHVAAARVVVHATGQDFLAHLDDLDAAE